MVPKVDSEGEGEKDRERADDEGVVYRDAVAGENPRLIEAEARRVFYVAEAERTGCG
jgi:hypothetical protein